MIPETLGHYRIQRSIGSGGMGEVYLAKDTKPDRNVALKVLLEDAARDPVARDGLSLDKILAIAIPLADAVAAAHERGITHTSARTSCRSAR